MFDITMRRVEMLFQITVVAFNVSPKCDIYVCYIIINNIIINIIIIIQGRTLWVGMEQSHLRESH